MVKVQRSYIVLTMSRLLVRRLTFVNRSCKCLYTEQLQGMLYDGRRCAHLRDGDRWATRIARITAMSGKEAQPICNVPCITH